MANQSSRFKKWLTHKRRLKTAGCDQTSQLTTESEDALVQLPSELADKLQASVNELPVPPGEKETVLTSVKAAIAQWQKQPHLANNSIVVLSHPISSVSRILMESLPEMRQQGQAELETRLLDWTERPTDIGSLKQQMQEKLALSLEDLPAEAKRKEAPGTEALGTEAFGTEAFGTEAFGTEALSTVDERARVDLTAQHLAVIPNLCWCFLRSAEGLDGIDYLQESLINDRRQFWVIGSGQVGWEYLKSTLKLHAYCGEVVTLSPLTGEQLQHWITPIIEQFNIRFSDAALHKRFQNPDSLLEMDITTSTPTEVLSEISQEVSATVRSSLRALKDGVCDTTAVDQEASPKQDYFERLADISDGVSMVALQLFVKSLRYRKVTSEDLEQSKLSSPPTANPNDEPKTEAEAPQRYVVAVIPKLPPLPELSQSDLYLLYSLMLHGDLTIRALSKSLGDAPQVVTNQVQVLGNAGVIEQRNGVIKANPVHYPKLRRELANNNFIIEVP